MKVVSFTSLVSIDGFEGAFKKLDKDVRTLGDINIFKLTDAVYLGERDSGPDTIVRVVVYEKKKKVS